MDILPNEMILIIYDNIGFTTDRLKYSMASKRHNNITKKLISEEISIIYMLCMEGYEGLSEIEYVRDYISRMNI
jgi:hypothetical protein